MARGSPIEMGLPFRFLRRCAFAFIHGLRFSLPISLPANHHSIGAKLMVIAFLPALDIFWLKIGSPSNPNGRQLLFIDCLSQGFSANPELLDGFGQ